ncbi:LamG domain-containing protein [Actinomadura litoris]|uniref:LamG domain-containing protein n=1 Tax=Actinomadura litoris TaxID=2678616 RepID=UPI001FA6B37D|nr:LamG domain-containing protein [Actinomadura litoris]
MADLPELPKLRVAGPFWAAETEVIRLADPGTNLAFRTLFADTTPREAVGEDDVLLPGTLLALVYVTGVTISPTNGGTPQYVWKRGGDKPDGRLSPAAIRAAISAGTVSLLLLQAPADGWPENPAGKLPTFTCLGGEIILDPMAAQLGATQKLYTALGIEPAAITQRTGAARLLGALAVHAAGLSVFGQVRLLWDTAPVKAVFQLARVVPDPQPAPGAGVRGFRMTIEAERLTEAERAALIASWRRLGRYLNPNNPLNGLVQPVPAPEWATLEPADPLAVPRLFWEIAPWQEQPGTRPISFAGDDFGVLLSDRRPYDQNAQPDTLARITPATARLTADGTKLRVDVRAGTTPTGSPGTLGYQAVRDGTGWGERITLAATTLAFDPNEAARRLRATAGEPEPTWSPAAAGAAAEPVAPAVLWGFAPLDDGWAQLPLPNLSEQVYLDAGAARAEPVPAPPNLLQGAVSFGNDDPAVAAQVPGEQPWSLTLAAAQRMTGAWTLAPSGQEFQLQSAALTLEAPEVALGGMFWLSTESPTTADALPGLDDWIGGLRTLPLRTVTGRELFPPLVRLAFEAISFAWRSRPAPSAALGAWAFQYGVDPVLLRALVQRGALPPDLLGFALPLVWRRHPALPMVQALALTQSLTPPNAPIGGRQLVPFELPVTRQDGVDLPVGWRFAADGAAGWPRYGGGALAPAREWLGADAAKLFDLPLLALSLPGLVLDPRPDGDPPQSDASLGLPVQYRYDLPYTDEVQALAQLPRIPADPRESSPLPDTAAPEPPRPLTRVDYAAHWRRLAERANLAAADDVAAFGRRDGQPVLGDLASAHPWPVKTTFVLDGYPGELRLDNADPAAPGAPLALKGETALQGVDGDFADGTNALRRLPAGSPPDAARYRVTAGSMAAAAGTGGYTDQRGLVRGASVSAANLIRTPLSHPTAGDVQLTTTRLPLTLAHGTASWRLWFRDLPAQGTTFGKASTRSPKAVELDLDGNDPEARSSDYEHRTGYEWRLRPLDDDPDRPGPGLDLFGLRFFPLVLDRVVFAGDGVAAVEVIGRLQLPVAGAGSEQDELSNCARLTFTGTGTELRLSAVALDGPPLEWPLATTAGEAGDAPRLRVGGIALAAGGTGLTVQQVRLYFHLFQVEWAVGLPPIAFPNPATPPFTLPGANGPAPIVPQRVALGLDMAGGKHTLNLTLAVRVGRPPSGLQALYRFDEGGGATVHDTSGTGEPLDLKAASSQGMSWSADGLTLTQARLIRSGTPARKLISAVKASDEISIEAWLRPVSGGLLNAQYNILTVSADAQHRNVTLQQRNGLLTSSAADAWLRTSATTDEGVPDLATPAGSLSTALTHLAYTRSADGRTRIYLNGRLAAEQTVAGSLDTWDDRYELALGDEITGDRAWLGTYRMLALYDRALGPEEVAARFAAGPATAPATTRGQAISAALTFDLMAAGADRFTLDSANLFGDLALAVALPDGSPAALAGDTALQFGWNGYGAPQPDGLQFLPGMRLADARTPGLGERAAPGFATVTFRATARPDDLPELPLTGAFVEALLIAHWGRSLQDPRPARTAEAAELYGSSSGDLVIGYTSRLQGKDWQEGFLLNGMLTATNLVSWPQRLSYDAANARITLPAARVAGPPPLTHLRHTIRVLLNQHELPGSTLTAADGPLLFTFAQGQSWQTPAVVEHQLVEVTPAANGGGTLGEEARWTTLQEVRLLTPRRAARFLRSLAALKAIDPADDVGPLGTVGGGYLGAGLSALLADPGAALDALPQDTLLVEASAHHMIGLTPVAEGAATTLQFLPTGSQGALLGSPADYAPSDPTDPRWMLLTMPFLGRLQDTARDLAAPAGQPSPLQTDPVLLIGRLRAAAPAAALPALALALCGWADGAPLNITLAGLDTVVGRAFARLDPLALEESWFRAQNPAPEPEGASPQSVLASLPETPARLSRPTALRQALDPRRPFYPPRTDGLPAPPEPSPYADPVWREDGLLLTQSVSTLTPATKPPYGWTLAAALIASSGLLTRPPTGQGPRRHPAATLIPAPLTLDGAANPRPLSLVVSPYQGLQWRPAPAVPQGAPSPLRTRLLLAELLCLSPSTMELQPVASRMWSVRPDTPDLADEGRLRAQAQGWAVQSQRLLAPESPIAVLRYRIISDNTRPDNLGEAALTTGYAFALVRVATASPLAKRLFRIRPELTGLRYREGQCNIAAIPASPHDFELAPPQTVGVQPLHLTQRPVRTDLPAWPWGLSALRVSVHYTEGQRGAVGAASPGAAGQTLWWQTVQQTVRFRSALHTDRPTGGLPRRFRAPAVSTLLPAPPDPPLPVLTGAVFDRPALPVADGPALERWQPVLPGGLRYLVTGARPGVFVTVRHQVLRQSGITLTGEHARPRGLAMLSGGLPVDHRTPRPVPLPPNDDGRQDVALRTWASHFDPEALAGVTASPTDEAFRAAFDDPKYRQTALRLRLRLAAVERSTLDVGWDGVLTFVYRTDGSVTLVNGQKPETPETGIRDWSLTMELVDAEHVTPLEDITTPTLALTPALRAQLTAAGVTLPDVDTIDTAEFAIRRFGLTGDPKTRADRARVLIAALPPGASLEARMKARFVPHQPGAEPYHDGYGHVLRFPLRVADPNASYLPLVPRYVHFEDPEYNRRLASPSAHAGVSVQFPKQPADTTSPQRAVTLSAERRECDPTSTLAIRYDWDEPPPGAPVATLALQKIDLDQTPRDLLDPTGGPPRLDPGKLHELSLAAIQKLNGPFAPGERLRLTLHIDGGPVKPTAVRLDITIVENPVIPATEAAYALLRKQTAGGHTQVECRRFAWGPQAQRVELVNPADLRTEVVRRRAVFQFTDSTRPAQQETYTIQKLGQTGSTHIPLTD